VKTIDPADLEAAANELKRNWKNVEREISRVAEKDRVLAKKVVATARKAVKKVAAKKKS
jgi:tRNA U34 5-methylaminomethyl-2-thiouridine-forming methyltransferase MnmC